MRTVFVVLLLAAVATGCGSSGKSGPRGALHGVVYEVGGSAAVGADVALVVIGGGAGAAFEAALTDGQGRFGFTGLAAGTYIVSALNSNGTQALADTVAIPDGEASPDTLRLAAGGTFAGTVTSSAGPPIANVSLAVQGLLAATTSDGAGNWVMRGIIPTGHWSITASHAGFAAGEVSATISTPAESVFVPIVLNPAVPRRANRRKA